jgi:hypothetical protein
MDSMSALLRAVSSALFVSGLALTAGASGFTPYCFGTQSACPCGNAGGPGAGCLNSYGTGSQLSGSGITSVSADTVTLTANGLPTTTTIVFFQGTSPVNNGLGSVLGDGLRCASGVIVRLGTRSASGGTCSFGAGVNGDPLLSAVGRLPSSGGRRYYQGWYRNTTSFCMPEGYNLSNGLMVDWVP